MAASKARPKFTVALNAGVRLLPKVRIEVAVSDAILEKVPRFDLARAANSNKIGDGEIFVLDLEQVMRIRTGERTEAALSS